MRTPLVDDTLGLAVHGYAWLPALRRNAGGAPVRTRVMGQPALVLRGADAARFFYDENNVRRHTAVPEPVLGTLFGKGAVHTLDGPAHRVRKAMFLSLMSPEGVDRLVTYTVEAWDAAARSWSGPVVLFDEASRILTRAVCRWAGVPLADDEVAAADLVALIDGFATLGPRHWRARRARGRLERTFAGLIESVGAGSAQASPDSAVATVATHRDADGELLDPRVAAVELLNVIRPTVAVCWFVAFAGHALHRWPGLGDQLRAGDDSFAEAFVHELRRFYPFAPFLGGRAVRDLSFHGEQAPAGSLVLLDVYGQHHDPTLWPDPYAFDPQRFIGRQIGAYDLIPQGGGDPHTGHRCPGEWITIGVLKALVQRVAALDCSVPAQDLRISLRRIPARIGSDFVFTPVSHVEADAVPAAVPATGSGGVAASMFPL
jgi:fatty-acid peroxygenase